MPNMDHRLGWTGHLESQFSPTGRIVRRPESHAARARLEFEDSKIMAGNHDPRVVKPVVERDFRSIEIRTAEWARLGLAREAEVKWIEPSAAFGVELTVDHKRMVEDAIGIKPYLHGDFGVSRGDALREQNRRACKDEIFEIHKALARGQITQEEFQRHMQDAMHRLSNPPMVVGVDHGKPGGDQTVVVTALKHADGTVTVRHENKPVGWRHKNGTVVQEDGRGGFVFSRVPGTWSKFPVNTRDAVAAALADPEKYTPIYEGERLFDRHRATHKGVNTGVGYCYDVQTRSVHLQRGDGTWKESRYIKPHDLNDRNRFTRI